MFSFRFWIFFLVSISGFSQTKSYKNQLAIVYKGILSVNNPNEIIVKFNHNVGLGYTRYLNENHALGLNVFYSRSKFFLNYLGIEPYYKYILTDGEKTVNPFLKVNAGVQVPIRSNAIIFTYTETTDNMISAVSEFSFGTAQKVFYANPEFGIDIKLGKKVYLEPSVGYLVSMRNFGSKDLDAHLKGISLYINNFNGPSSINPEIENLNSNYFEPLNFSFGVILGMKF